MRLGLALGYWGRDGGLDDLALAVAADRIGYDVAWVAEAYSSDAVSVLGWLAGRTERISIGSAVMQIPARSPAATAMAAATLDTLSDGRFRLGLGVSGPQVSEGWHGAPFGRPLERTREYVETVRTVLTRSVVERAGPHYPLPLPGGPGKALRLAFRPLRPDVPVYLAAVGDRSMALAGEIADGWLSAFTAPSRMADSIAALGLGRRAGRPFDVVAQVQTVVGDDPEHCADRVRKHVALYVGGMGSSSQNFYHRLVSRMGYERAADEVQRAYLAGDRAAAEAALPFELLDEVSLLGPVDRIAARMQAYREAGVTTLTAMLAGVEPADRQAAVEAVAAAHQQSRMGQRG